MKFKIIILLDFLIIFFDSKKFIIQKFIFMFFLIYQIFFYINKNFHFDIFYNYLFNF